MLTAFKENINSDVFECIVNKTKYCLEWELLLVYPITKATLTKKCNLTWCLMYTRINFSSSIVWHFILIYSSDHVACTSAVLSMKIFWFCLLTKASLSLLSVCLLCVMSCPVERSVNLPGQTGFCGASDPNPWPLTRKTQWAQRRSSSWKRMRSILWRLVKICTRASWNTKSVITSPSLASSH